MHQNLFWLAYSFFFLNISAFNVDTLVCSAFVSFQFPSGTLYLLVYTFADKHLGGLDFTSLHELINLSEFQCIHL